MDRRDQWHAAVREFWARPARSPILVPAVVLPEVCYLVGTRLGAEPETRFMRSVVAGEFTLEPLEDADIPRATDLMIAYADLPLDFVDAAVVAAAERLGVTSILTTDRKHFGTVRPRHTSAFRLEP